MQGNRRAVPGDLATASPTQSGALLRGSHATFKKKNMVGGVRREALAPLHREAGYGLADNLEAPFAHSHTLR